MDAALRAVLDGAPDATVVALGEGFETQFWRVDNGRLRWLTVDLSELLAVRREVLPEGPRNRTLAGSAADAEWIAQLDVERPVIITAQGLLPYFERDEAHHLLTQWARRAPGAWLLFDAVTPTLQAARRRSPSADAYHPPEWSWTVDAGELAQLRDLPGLTDQHEVSTAAGDPSLATLRRMIGEMQYGVTAADDPLTQMYRRQRVQAVLDRFELLAFDVTTAEYYGALAALVRQHGRNPRPRHATA